MNFHFSFWPEGEGLIPVASYSIDACEDLLQSLFFTNEGGLPNATGDALHRRGQPLNCSPHYYYLSCVCHVCVAVGPASRLWRQALKHGAQVDVAQALDHQVGFRQEGFTRESVGDSDGESSGSPGSPQS